MSSLQKTFVVVLPLLLLFGSPVARAQSSSRTPAANGTKITVDETSYSVTPLGNFLRVDDLDGHMIGMARKDGSVIAPQSGPAFDTIKAVASAYLHPGKGAPQPEPKASSETLAPPPSQPPSSEAAANDRFVFPATGGAILKGTPFGDITFSADGTEARAAQKTTSPVVGETTIELIARYRGGDDPAKGKAAGVVRGGAKVLFESMNPRAKGNVNTRGNDEIVVSQSTNGGKESAILGTGEKHVASHNLLREISTQETSNAATAF